jgi:hypothetical protein
MAAGQTDLVYFLGVPAIGRRERKNKKLQWRDGSEEYENFTKMSFL